MRVFVFLTTLFGIIFSFIGFMFADEIWEAISGITETDLKEVAVDPNNERIIYASSSRILYRTEDGGAVWEAVFSVDTDDNIINFIGISKKALFICTGDGLFKSPDGRSEWKRIFRRIVKEENQVSHIAFSKDKKIYLGTAKGLFSSSDNGLTWEKDDSEAGNIGVRWIDFLKDTVFIATEKGAYRKLDHGWKRVFVTPAPDTEEGDILIDEDGLIEEENSVNSLLVNDGVLFLATEEGIFVSNDKGESCYRFVSAGLAAQEVKRLLFKDRLFAVTNEGMFVFSEENRAWKALYKGISTKKARAISSDKRSTIWIATDKGLYRALYPKWSLYAARDNFVSEDGEEDIFKRFEREPGVRDVQNAAIAYAEVQPEKIQLWRKQAGIKAFLPALSLDYDKTVTYDSGSDRYYIGPYDWGVSVSWDLGDIVWNNDQTSIDVRSRLMVQLRDDILDEITRTYFERRRLQMDVYLLQTSQDLKQKLQKELRLQELTADLDALTGGYFSDSIKEAQKQEF